MYQGDKKMKLITELTEEIFMSEQIIDEATGKKELYIEGVFMQGGIKNRNGRMYPVETLANEVKKYNENYVQKNRALGELGHPSGPTINLDRVSHMITELKQDGRSGNFMGKAKILETPMGEIVKNLMQGGAQLGVSSRGMGSLKPTQDGTQMVQSDFHLATAADIVADPSAPDAYVDGIMEGKEWVWDNGLFKEVDAAAHHTQIKEATSAELEQVKLKVFENFVSKL